MRSHPAPEPSRLLPSANAGVLLLALSLPWLLTYSLPPTSTFVNQIAAWAAWALLVVMLSQRAAVTLPPLRRVIAAVAPMLLILLCLIAAAAASVAVHGLPASLAWSAVACLAGAVLLLLAGATFGAGPFAADALRLLFFPLVAAGLLSALFAAVQIFQPEWTGNALISGSSYVGRASANLRQPNHLSSLALWAIVGVIWLRETSALPRLALWLSALLLVAAVVLTGSRTGALGIVLLAGWGVVDRSLSSSSRRLLWLLPVAYAVGWWLFKWWAAASLGSADAVDRIASGGDVSSARFAIWSNTVELIRSHPLFGVGFGEFNLVWTLTPFPGRPTQFYDHSHNLVLQWLVELGIPLGMLLLAAAALSIWRCWRADSARPAARAPLLLILLILLHSLLEYPLWYLHFLLPTMFAIGICLAPSSAAAPPEAERAGHGNQTLRLAAVVMLAGTAFAVHDYRKIVVIFSPPADAAPLGQRIADGKRSVFFAHHAHYAQATTAERPSQELPAFEHASHFLLDTRLMMAWAKAFDELGDQRRARHLADRLREFGNPGSQAFLAVCDGAQPAEQLPFQCRPASAPLDAAAFR
ncbi:Wzy polymerase domain-containing protein [Piscinibacter sakaiensis]|uniref:PglL family O-oligosaccharyltransferase n=1 Tax=Piscinibacter sakaiensis TaxID=1547922 RepID=UPI003AAB0C6E